MGRVRVRVSHLFFVRALRKTCLKSQIFGNVNHLLRNLPYLGGGGGGRGEGGVGEGESRK